VSRPKWGQADAMTVFVGVPIVASAVAGWLVSRIAGPGAGMFAACVLLAALAVVSLCLIPVLAKWSNAPGWPEFEREHGDQPLWWLGRRR
jgi:hypothetical protein